MPFSATDLVAKVRDLLDVSPDDVPPDPAADPHQPGALVDGSDRAGAWARESEVGP